MDKKKAEEKVLVIKAEDAFKKGNWQGINTEFIQYIFLLSKEQGKFLRRGEVEDDPSWQQIIPYIVVRHNQKVFLMQRKDTASEKRLASLYSIGVGGHIRAEDLKEGETFIDWSRREMDEELDYKGKLVFDIVGVLNDLDSEVGSVHLGIIILAEIDNTNVAIRDEHQTGKFVNISELKNYYGQLEGWSRIVFDHLNQNN